MSVLKYRPDIDGLRAIAVLSVILFHAGMPHMGGGYVGVDVFFVISGYLIGSLIFKELQAGVFSFARFWERRARRILPALFFMVAATVLAGWFWFLPEDYAALGKQVAAQSVFGSNILFYKQSGYFDQDSFLKPLLHTWSLAVEEQFYILFPLAAVFVWRRMQNGFFKFLFVFAIVSFILCLIVMHANAKLAFYMLPFRAWELLVGALLAYRAPALSPRYRPMVAVAGLAAILLPVFLYTESTMFPGIGALPPVLGAAAIIWAGAGGTTPLNRFLSWRPVVFVGLVSYSWYLWHWPVIVFAKYMPNLAYDGVVATACVTGSFILAVFSWRYVERPFRRSVWCPERKQMFLASLVGLSVLGAVGVGAWLTDGTPWRLAPNVMKYAQGISDSNPHRKECDKPSIANIKADKVCETAKENGAPSFILWGDSQADAIAPAFYALSQKYKRNGIVVTHHGCEAIIGFHKTDWDAGFTCHDFNDEVMKLIERQNIKHVFLVSAYNSWMKQNTSRPDAVTLEGIVPEGYQTKVAAGLAKTIDTLKENGAEVFLMQEIPHTPFDPARTLALNALHGNAKAKIVPYKNYIDERDKRMGLFLEKYGPNKVVVLDPAKILCPDEGCIYEQDGYSLYFNPSHLSTKGALYLAPLFEPYFKEGF